MVSQNPYAPPSSEVANPAAKMPGARVLLMISTVGLPTLIGVASGALIGHSAGVFDEFYFPESRGDAFFSIVIDHVLTGAAQGFGCGFLAGMGILLIGCMARLWFRRPSEQADS